MVGLVGLATLVAFTQFGSNVNQALADNAHAVEQRGQEKLASADLTNEMASSVGEDFVKRASEFDGWDALVLAGMFHGNPLRHPSEDAPRQSRPPPHPHDDGQPAGAPKDGNGGGVVCDDTGCRPGSGKCFVAGTLVTTPDGPRPIEEIVPGDRVASRDEETGVVSDQSVVRTYERRSASIYRVYMRSDDGARVTAVDSTPNHPYWKLAGGFTRADALVPGDVLLDARGAFVRVAAAESVPGEQTVYNLEVSTTHTYFVGADSVWVHNVGPSSEDAVANSQLAQQLHTAFFGPVVPGGNNFSTTSATVAVATYTDSAGKEHTVVSVNTGANAADTAALRNYVQREGFDFAAGGKNPNGTPFHAEENAAAYAQRRGWPTPDALGVDKKFCTTAKCSSISLGFNSWATPADGKKGGYETSDGWHGDIPTKPNGKPSGWYTNNPSVSPYCP